MTFSFTTLGANSATPTIDGNPSSFVLRAERYSVLFDCGEGTQKSLLLHQIKSHRISHICISHLHGDHVYGLFGLVSTYSLQSRVHPLTIIGPKGIKDLLESVGRLTSVFLTYHIEVIEIDHEEGRHNIYENEDMIISAFPQRHGITCYGYLWQEKGMGRRIRPGVLEKYDIDYDQVPALREGEDIMNRGGDLIKNSILTLDSNPSKSLAYCTDTMFMPENSDFIKGVNLLYHEATYSANDQTKAHKRNHSTSTEAARMALLADAEKLVIGHVAARYADKNVLLEEAKKIFPDTVLACEGQSILL